MESNGSPPLLDVIRLVDGVEGQGGKIPGAQPQGGPGASETNLLSDYRSAFYVKKIHSIGMNDVFRS